MRQFGVNAQHYYAREFARERGLAHYERVIRSITAADDAATGVDGVAGASKDGASPTSVAGHGDARLGEAAEQQGGTWRG